MVYSNNEQPAVISITEQKNRDEQDECIAFQAEATALKRYERANAPVGQRVRCAHLI